MSDHSAPLIAQPSTSPSNESAAHPLSPAEQRIEGAIKQVKAEIAQLEEELQSVYHKRHTVADSVRIATRPWTGWLT